MQILPEPRSRHSWPRGEKEEPESRSQETLAFGVLQVASWLLDSGSWLLLLSDLQHLSPVFFVLTILDAFDL